MIRAMLNLRCTDGHYRYSPTPKEFVGKQCAKPFGNPIRVDGLPRVTVPKCSAILKVVK